MVGLVGLVGCCIWVWRNSPFWPAGLYVVLPVPPHFFGLAQRNGVEPQRKTLGVVAPP